jgi:hypothetical protein
MPDVIPCRIIESNGDIHDGHVAIVHFDGLLGYHFAAPVEFIEGRQQRFKFDHFTERGAAVYLEVE